LAHNNWFRVTRPVFAWYDGLRDKAVAAIAFPFQARHNQLFAGGPKLVRDDAVVGEVWEDEAFGFGGAVVLDDEFEY
jgi:hypothetical protein